MMRKWNSIFRSSTNVDIRIETDEILLFSVKDDGIKLTPMEMEKIWNKINDFDVARVEEFGKYGMGLAMTGRMLELNRAKYGCERMKEETVFWFGIRKAK